MKNKIAFMLLMLCSTNLFSQSPISNNYIFSSNIKICLNSSISNIGASVPYGGNGTFNYKWISSNTSESSGFVNASGTNNGQFYSPPSPFTDTVWYKRVVTSGIYVDTSSVSAVFVVINFANFQINFPSTSTPLCEGREVEFVDYSLIGSSSFIERKWSIDSSADFYTNDYFNSSKYITFPSPGNYNVKLVTSYLGCTDSITKIITILPKPKAKIVFLNNSMQCIGSNSFSFKDSSSFIGGNYDRKWTFSNKIYDTSIITNPTKIYDSIGSYVVKLLVTAPNGCYTNAVQHIDVIPSISNNIIFGNQTICAGEKPSTLMGSIPIGTNSGILKEEFTADAHTEWWGTDALWIAEEHGWNSSEYLWHYDNINVPSGLSGFFDTRYVQQQRSFLISKIFTPSNQGDSLRFDVSSVMNCNYQGACQNYDSLIIFTSNGSGFNRIKAWSTSLTIDTLTGITTKNVIYYGCNRCGTGTSYGTWAGKKLALPAGTIQVKFEFYSSKTYAANGIHIDNVVIDSSTSKTIEYKWLVSTESATSGFVLANAPNNNQYFNSQNLTQTSWFKRVVLNNGFSDTSAAIKINVIPAITNFFVNSISQCTKGNLFMFNDTASISNVVLNRIWNFGEGLTDTSNLITPTKIYTNPGSYLVSLTVTRNGNCKDSITKTITVKPSPIIGNIIGNTTPNSTVLPFNYSILSQSNSTYNWNTINGNVQNGLGTNSINIIWPNPGTGSVKIKVTNNVGCKDSSILNVNITSVGIDNLSLDNDLKVYPNPTKSTITITNKNNLVGKKYIITNLVGQIVISGELNLNDTIVNIESLESGVYLLSIDGLNKQSIKLIKE